MKVSGGSRIEDDPLIGINIILQDKKIPLKIVFWRKDLILWFSSFLNQNKCLSWNNNILLWIYVWCFSTKFISIVNLYL